MQTNDIIKLNKLLKAIEINFTNVQITFCVWCDGSVTSVIRKNLLYFKNLKQFVKSLAFLIDAKFSPLALERIKKEKKPKKKNIFFYWLAMCVNFQLNKDKTLAELRQEFNELYGIEMNQGRKPKKTAESGSSGATEAEKRQLY